MKYPNIDVDIRDIQLVQIEILEEFDRICQKHKIRYELFAGTLLGAVRHKGFIPWDDDIDVCMLRRDYERFVKICPKELDSKFFLQTYRSDPKSVFQFAKIRKNNTVFINNLDCNASTNTGIYIDIFPMDNIYPQTFFGEVQRIGFNIIYAVINSSIKESIEYSHNSWVRFCRKIAYFISKFIPKVLMDILAQKTLKMFNKNETKYVNHISNRSTKSRYKRFMRRRDSFEKTVMLEFEGKEYPGPANYDEVLTNIYGNYMQLPPEDKQKPHHGIINVKV